MSNHWRLPHGVDEVLPPAARELELLRRAVLDLFHGWGFDYVEPPIIDYLDSLLVTSGSDLDLQTFKVVDQKTGRQLGVRADMSSQAARIDAHSRRSDSVQRLCYAGTVVFANPAQVYTSRVPFKAGAEIFGNSGVVADAEVVALMVEVARLAGVASPVALLGHMGIYRALVAGMDLNEDATSALFAAVQRKAQSDVADIVAGQPGADMLIGLPALLGRDDVLIEATNLLSEASSPILEALADLGQLAELVRARCPGLELRFDLSELTGYGYHNGPVFSLFQPNDGQALAQGGRYDGIGAAFGASRPATGFDVDLKRLLAGAREGVAAGGVQVDQEAIFAPSGNTPSLLEKIARLRSVGKRVVQGLGDESPPAECSLELTATDSGWQIRKRL